MWWAVVSLGLLGVTGLLLATLGVRGRRVGEHPTCRRCGFDLFGTPNAPVCNECGGDLTRRRATRVGHRRRRPWLLSLGVLALLPALLVGGAAGYVAWRGVDLQPYKPAWWLVRDVAGRDATVADAAVAELVRRSDFNLIDDARRLAAVDALLLVQADAGRPWGAKWGDWIEGLHAAGVVDADRFARYTWQSVVPTLRVRPHVRQGDPLPAVIEFARRGGTVGARMLGEWTGESYRVGETDMVEAAWSDRSPETREHSESSLDPVRQGEGDSPRQLSVPFKQPGSHLAVWNGGPSYQYLPSLPGGATARLPVGRHRARLRFTYWLAPARPRAYGTYGTADLSRARARAMSGRAQAPPPGDWVRADLTADVDVDPADAARWRVLDDEAARRATEAAVEVSVVRPQKWGGDKRQVQIYVKNLPTALFLRAVELRPSDGVAGEAAAGEIFGLREFAAGQTTFLSVSFDRLPAPDATRVDVVLTPRTDHLLTMIDPPPAYGRPVVIPNVPVAADGPRYGVDGPHEDKP